MCFVSFEVDSKLRNEYLGIEELFKFGYSNVIVKQIEDREKSKLSSFCTNDLSSLQISFSDESEIKIEGNKIIHSERNCCETCVIGPPMKNGIHRITFEKDMYNCNLGIICVSLEGRKCDKSISEELIGCEVESIIYSKKISLKTKFSIIVIITIICIFVLFFFV